VTEYVGPVQEVPGLRDGRPGRAARAHAGPVQLRARGARADRAGRAHSPEQTGAGGRSSGTAVSYPACGSASIRSSHLAPLGPLARKIAIFADELCGLLN
jgi:hypothetical protein